MRKEIQLLLLCLALAWDCSRCASSTRYLDVSNGQDTPECLNSQTSPKNACQTLQYALNNANSEDGSGLSDVHLFVLPGKYTYAEAGIEMWFSKNLTIEKAPGYSGSIVFQCADYSENTYNNFAFLNSSDITIAGLHVEMCGWNSAGLFFENSTSVSVTNCTFTNCTGSGITTLNSNVHISNSCFMDNTGMKVDYLSLSYNVDSSFIRIYTSGAIAVLHSATSTQVVIDNCMFINNSASINEMNRNDSRKPVFKPIGHGGAIVLRFAGNSHNSSVLVTNCLFKNNSADHFGGAIYIPLSTGTESNEIVLSNNSFENNKAGTSGGAVILEIFRTGKSSKLYIKDTNFTDNEATFGGGAVSINHQYPLTIASDSTSELVVFENCVFQGNSAPTGGSAVGLVSNARVDQASLSISFKDCYFIENTAQTRSALLSFRFHMVFLGTVTFQNNSGGAISLLQSRLDSRGTLNITGNAASEGAGLTITDFSLLHLHNGTQVNFKENRAETSGGAILVEDISSSDDFTVIYNILCFVQYEIERSGTRERPTNQWNASVVFTGNTAGISGSGIHATDIGKCTFTGLSCEEMQDDATLFEQSIFHENKGKFHFSAGNFMTGNVSAVSTEPSELKVRQIPENTTSAAPGERKTFLITAFDQSANPSEAIFNYSLSIEESAVQLFGLSAEDTNFTIPFNVSEECAFDNHAFLEFELIQSLSGETVNEVMIPFNIRCCYPGYYLDSNSTVETCKINKDYPYLLRADDRNKYLYLQPGSYAGFHNIGNESIFTVALLPFTFQRCNTQRNRPGCLYKYDQPDDQCFGNRAGFMCGECPQDQGLDLTLTSCRKCNEKDPIVFSFACILVFVLCILVMFFNIGVPNDLRGFLFYAQVVGFVYAKNLGSNSWEYYFSHILGVSFPLPICPFTKLSSLWTVAMGILSPILALLAITVYIISARYLRFLSERTSFSGIWLIILFAYKYTVDTAFNAVKCIKLQGQEIESNYQLKLVFFYDGTIPCFDGEHLILAVPALIVLLLVLFIVPSFIIVIGFKHLKRTQPFTDVITDQIHANCRWWSGFDLIRRVLFVVVVTVSDPQYTQLALCFLTIGILATLCVFKPYKKMVINIIEVVILMDLLIIAVYFLNKKMELHNVSPVVQALLLLPFIYACINVLGRVSLMLRNIFFPTLTVNSLVEKVKASALMKKHYTDEVALVEVNNSGAEGTELCSSYTQLREDLLEYCET